MEDKYPMPCKFCKEEIEIHEWSTCEACFAEICIGCWEHEEKPFGEDMLYMCKNCHEKYLKYDEAMHRLILHNRKYELNPHYDRGGKAK